MFQVLQGTSNLEFGNSKAADENKLEKIMMSDLKGDFDYVSTEHF